jgi:hypothetical protein
VPVRQIYGHARDPSVRDEPFDSPTLGSATCALRSTAGSDSFSLNGRGNRTSDLKGVQGMFAVTTRT